MWRASSVVLAACPLLVCSDTSASKIYVAYTRYIGAMTADNPYGLGLLDFPDGGDPRHSKPVQKFVAPEQGEGYCNPKLAAIPSESTVVMFAGPGCFERGGSEGDKQFADPKLMEWHPGQTGGEVFGNFKNIKREGYQMGPMFKKPHYSPKQNKFYMFADYAWQDHGPEIQWLVEVDRQGNGNPVYQFPSGLESRGDHDYDDAEEFQGSELDPTNSKLYAMFHLLANIRDSKGRITGCCNRSTRMKIFDLPSVKPRDLPADGVPKTLFWDAKNQELLGMSAFQFGVVSCSGTRCEFTKAGTLAKLNASEPAPGRFLGPDEYHDQDFVFDSSSRQLTISTTGCYKFDDPSYGCRQNTATEKFAQYTLPDRVVAGEMTIEPTIYKVTFNQPPSWGGMALMPDAHIELSNLVV